MTGMIDVVCPKCCRRYGWVGKLKDRPKCPRCGHYIPAADLTEDSEALREFKEFLAKRKDKKK